MLVIALEVMLHPRQSGPSFDRRTVLRINVSSRAHYRVKWLDGSIDLWGDVVVGGGEASVGTDPAEPPDFSQVSV